MSTRSNRIYENIAKDMKDLIERKSRFYGDYVMPKLVNLNVSNDRKGEAQRKANPFEPTYQ
jgi:hypothetical protein